jgi:hypothetical protein
MSRQSSSRSRGHLIHPAWLTACLALALCVVTDSPSFAETPAPSPTPTDSDGDGLPDRMGLTAALEAAHQLGAPVEDLSQRTSHVRVMVGPDGTVEHEAHASPAWVQDGSGRWVDVDFSLVPAAGGGYSPRAAATQVVIDGGGAAEFARMQLPEGGSMIWSWPVALPKPTVDGPHATYAVSEGVDLVVTATSLGVSTRIRINAPDAVAPEFTVQVRTEHSDHRSAARVSGRGGEPCGGDSGRFRIGCGVCGYRRDRLSSRGGCRGWLGRLFGTGRGHWPLRRRPGCNADGRRRPRGRPWWAGWKRG